jgi:hypothetical protein
MLAFDRRPGRPPWHRAVVHDLDVFTGEFVELGVHCSLAPGALGPNSGADRLVAQCQDQRGESRMARVARANVLFAPLGALLVFALRQCTAECCLIPAGEGPRSRRP